MQSFAGQRTLSSKWSGLFLMGLLLLSACDTIQIFPEAPTSFPGAVSTFAAETLSADNRLRPVTATTAANSATQAPSHTPPIEPSPVYTITRTPLPTLTQTALPTATVPMLLPDGSLAPCNAAQFIQDVSIPDGTPVRPGQIFTKVWEFKNIGNCTWTKNYAVVLVWGNPMGVASPVPLRQVVHPGEHVEIALNMKAPYIPACWEGWWKFQDEEGNRFGIDFKFAEVFWVRVGVYIPGIPSTKEVCVPKW